MVQLKNSNAKTETEYFRYDVHEIDVKIVRDIINNYTKIHNPHLHNDNQRKQINPVKCDSKLVGKSNKWGKCYLDIPMSFDIETTTLQDEKVAFMYIWQFGLCDNVIIGREWNDFIKLLDTLKRAIQPRKNQRVICYIANLGYEFQFMRNRIDITDSFLKEQRSPCYIEHDNWLVFQDALLMTNSSLAKLAKDYTNTQKCVNDLDYDVVRTKHTQLTPLEMSYCDNDVLILTEWARYYYDTYLVNHYKPLTITGVLERQIREAYQSSGVSIEETKPQSKEEYEFIMSWLYRGGYCHANELYIEHLFTEKDNIMSFDFTSSYPSCMTLQRCFPSVWEDVGDTTIYKMLCLSKKYCTWGIYTFYDIEATTDQTIESKHKAISLEGAVLDNGRIRKARKLCVALTDLDLLSYVEFYRWNTKKSTVENCHKSEKRYLDAYFVKTMLEKYVAKDVLKKLGKPYASEKALCNSAYGLSVKRLNSSIMHYENGKWIEDVAKTYDEQMQDKPFSPWVGIYISAMARRNLLSTVYQLHKQGKQTLYCDTDSLKILNYDATAEKIINNYNAHISKLIDLACERYDIKRDNVDDLGMFDCEYEKVTRLKFLGAKRYLISYMKKGKEYHAQTVAGLPKNELFKRYDVDTAYSIFADDMEIVNCKLTSKYIDEPTRIVVDGVEHIELSSIALLHANFKMNIDDIWTQLYLQYQKENNREVYR